MPSTSACENVCKKCHGLRRPNHAGIETDSNMTPGMCPTRSRKTGGYESDFSDVGLGGDGDTLRRSSLSSSNPYIMRSSESKQKNEEYLNSLKDLRENNSEKFQKQDGLKTFSVPSRTESRRMIAIIIIFMTASVALTSLAFMKEITKLNNSLKELQNQVKTTDTQNSLGLRALENNFKTIVDDKIYRKLRNLGYRDCQAIAGKCAWDICMGGFPSLLGKALNMMSTENDNLDLDRDFIFEDAGLEPESDASAIAE